MENNFSYKGQWFLPSDKNDELNGILHYDVGSGGTLELFGVFKDVGFFQKEEIILGKNYEGKLITLYECRMTNIQLPSGITYHVDYILEGEEHIDNAEKMKFQEIRSEIFNLYEWFGTSGFSLDITENANAFNLYYREPSAVKFTVNNEIKGEINCKVASFHVFNFADQKDINLKQIPEVLISSCSERPLKELLEYLFKFRNFLTIALYAKTHLICIKTCKKETKELKIYFQQENVVSNKLKYYNMLFCYKNIEKDFQVIIRNWFDKYENLNFIFNILVSQFYRNEHFIEDTFLNLVRAVEALYLETNERKKTIAKEEFEKIKEEIHKSVPENYHKWLKCVESANELGLHQRLTEIVNKYSNTILDKIIGDRNGFIKNVRDQRNIYTHRPSSKSKKKKEMLEPIDLFDLANKLKILLVCAILTEIGFSKEKIEELLSNCQSICYLIKPSNP